MTSLSSLTIGGQSVIAAVEARQIGKSTVVLTVAPAGKAQADRLDALIPSSSPHSTGRRIVMQGTCGRWRWRDARIRREGEGFTIRARGARLD